MYTYEVGVWVVVEEKDSGELDDCKLIILLSQWNQVV